MMALVIIAPHLAARCVNLLAQLSLAGMQSWGPTGTILRLLAIPALTSWTVFILAFWDISGKFTFGFIGAAALFSAIATVVALDLLFRNWRRLNVF